MVRAIPRPSGTPASSRRWATSLPGPTYWWSSPATGTSAPASAGPPGRASPRSSASNASAPASRPPTTPRYPRLRRLAQPPATRSLERQRREVGERRGQQPARAAQRAAAPQRAQADGDRLGGLRALGPRRDVRRAHHAGGQRLVERDHPVALGDAQPQVVFRGVAVARVVAPEGQHQVAAEGGRGVGDRVEAHQHAPDVPGGEARARCELAALRVDLALAAPDDGHGGLGVEDRKLALEAPGLRPVVGVLHRHDRRPRLPQPGVEGAGDPHVLVHAQDADPGVPGGERLGDLHRAVGRPVVDHDQLQRLDRLSQHRVDRPRERVLVVVGADEDADPRGHGEARPVYGSQCRPCRWISPTRADTTSICAPRPSSASTNRSRLGSPGPPPGASWTGDRATARCRTSSRRPGWTSPRSITGPTRRSTATAPWSATPTWRPTSAQTHAGSPSRTPPSTPS